MRVLRKGVASVKKENPASTDEAGAWGLLQVEFFLELRVGFFILALKVLKEAAAFVHLFQETAAGRVVFFVLLQVLREFQNLRGQDRDLHLWRTGVGSVCAKLLNNLLLFLCIEHRCVY